MKILCATDLMPRSDPAIDRAALLAAQLDAELHLLHVIPPASSASELDQHLREANEQMKQRIRAPQWRHGRAPHTSIRIGGPAQMLRRTAAELRADLVVLGPHESRASRDALSGTIVARMLGERRCPVLIVREPAQGAYRDVLLALGLHESSPAIVRAAESLVLSDHLNASIVHSCHFPYTTMLDSYGITTEEVAGYSGVITAQAREKLNELVARESSGAIQYDLIVRKDPPAMAIEKAARRKQPDLIVMGTRGQGPLRRALLGSVASRILKTVKTDLLVVPEETSSSAKAGWSRARAIPEASVSRHGLS